MEDKRYDCMVTLSVEYIPPHDPKPYGRNARTHSRKQIRQIADSIRLFGFTNPILIDSHNMILAGQAASRRLHCMDLSFVLSVFSLRASDTSILPNFAFHRVGDSSTVEQRTLTPPILVRIQVPQPGNKVL